MPTQRRRLAAIDSGAPVAATASARPGAGAARSSRETVEVVHGNLCDLDRDRLDHHPLGRGPRCQIQRPELHRLVPLRPADLAGRAGPSPAHRPHGERLGEEGAGGGPRALPALRRVHSATGARVPALPQGRAREPCGRR